MTHVFSGNGMSQQVADWIGEIPSTTGFVFPVYGWRIPKVMRTKKYAIEGDFVWAVMTCGDDAGYTERTLEKLIGRKLDAVYSVVMPDTYLGLPGFRLDTTDETARKLEAAKEECAKIREQLLKHTRETIVRRGALPWFKTKVIGGIFDRFLVTDRYYRVDAEKCVKCWRCVAECPVGAIEATEEGLPRWKVDGSCTMCFRCYHHCIGDAIEYGKFTKGKGRLFSKNRPTA